jgi:SAM-dependent methyltransferase
MSAGGGEKLGSVERLSFEDGSLLGGYAESVDRLALAAPWCLGKHVLDAGCGTGLGARYLLEQGAGHVLGIDYSTEAIREADRLLSGRNAEFIVGNLHELDTLVQGRRFGAIVSFETLPHLHEPQQFLAAVAQSLEPGGAFIVSTPNLESIPLDVAGKPRYRYQHAAYTPSTLESLLHGAFTEVQISGQWLTPWGKLRRQRAAEQFAYLCESYYQPTARMMRLARRLFGRPTLPAPESHVQADAYPGDFQISPIEPAPLPWAATSLIAICRP